MTDLIGKMLNMFEYDFMVRAIVGGILVSLCAALLGVSLVLKRYSMIGDGLSHVGFGSLAIAASLNMSAPLELAMPVVVISAFFLLRLSENSKIKGDAAIALVSTSALAIGIMAATMTKSMDSDINSYLFGSILSMSEKDMWFSIVLSVIVLALFVLFYNKIFAVTFDESFARATGTKAGIYNMVIAMLTALTIVVGMKIMGTLLISSLIIFPAITSMRVCKRFITVVVTSAVISVVCFFTGLLISYLHSTPVGASIVIVNLAGLLIFSLSGALIRAVGSKK